MEPQPYTSVVAGTSTAGRDDEVQRAVASISGYPSGQQQQDDQLLVTIPTASLKQFRQLFGATCQVKLQRCDIPVPDTNNAVVIATATPAEVPSDSRAVTVAKVEEENTGSGSSSEDDEVQVLPAPLAKTKRIVTKKKGNSNRKSPVPCPVCKKRMCSKAYLKVHMLKHSGEKRYRCEHCGRPFWNRTTFSGHKKARAQRNGVCPRKKMSGEWRPKGPWTCKICGKRMKNPSHYLAHMRSHRGDTRFKCGECGKAFVRNSELSVHKRIHSDVWQFNCVFCEKRFHHKHAFFGHLRVHTEEMPYFCVVDGCGESFRHFHSLKMHRRLIHLKKY